MDRATWKPRCLEGVNRAYTAYLAQGFATADFDGQPEPETLQCRNELDRTNWIGLLIECQANIAALNGAGSIPSPGIRCSSNRMYVVTYDDAAARMFALLGQVQAAQANWWRLKDDVAAAETNAALRAIDLTEGWP